MLASNNNINNAKRAFNLLFESYYKPLYLFVNSHVRNVVIAEDIVEDSFIKLWEKRHEIRHEQAIYSWLCTTARNHALNLLQAEKKLTKKKENVLQWLNCGEESDHLERMMRAELTTELHRLIHLLPPQCSNVITSLFINDKSVAETASDLNLSVNTVKSHKARGIRLLRHKLRPLLLALLLAI